MSDLADGAASRWCRFRRRADADVPGLLSAASLFRT